MQKLFFSNRNSNNISNPFAYFPSSYNNNNNLLDHIFHHDLASATNSQVMNEQSLINMALLNNATLMTKQDVVFGVGGGGLLNGDYFGFGPSPEAGICDMIPPLKKKKKSSSSVKKDRHSKIRTAQGVRDRRVRLSIDIAREFFDLQDMLGFDKASKTLEWLLTKSKNAIRELVKVKQLQALAGGGNNIASNNLSSSSECEIIVAHDQLEGSKLKKEKKSPIVAKESRAKARARARKRTREKMWKLACPPQLRSSLPQLEASSSFTHPELGQNWDISGARAHSSFCAITNVNLSTGVQIYGKP